MAAAEPEIKSALETRKLQALSIPGRVNVEYLLHTARELTPAEKDAIYKIMVTYPFPMNMNPLNRRIIEQLSPEEQHSLYHFEMLFLQRKINEVAPDITVLAIPKTAYQLYFLVHCYSRSLKVPDFTMAIHYTNDNEMYESILTELNDPEYQKAWWTINQSLIQYWMSVDNIDNFIESLVAKFIHTINENFDAIPRKYLGSHCNSGRDLGYYLLNNSLAAGNIEKMTGYLKGVIKQEFQECSHYLLYCAVDKTQTNFKPSASISWSFGDGLITGFPYDSGTCPIQLLVRNETFLPREIYTFSLEKDRYLQQNSLEFALFFIPPLPNFLRMVGGFEFYHGRTKVSSQRRNFCFGTFECTSSAVKDRIGKQQVFIANNLAPEVHEQELARLCRENYKKTPMANSAITQPFLGFQYPNLEQMREQIIEQNVRRAMVLS